MCGAEAGDRSSQAIPLGHTASCAPAVWADFCRNFSLAIFGLFSTTFGIVYTRSFLRGLRGGFVSVSTGNQKSRGERRCADRRSYFLDPTFLEKILLLLFGSPPPPPPRFSEKCFRGFVRVGGRPNSVRVGAVAEPTSHSFQHRPTSGTPDGSRSTVLQTQFFSRPLRRRTHSKNESTGCK